MENEMQYTVVYEESFPWIKGRLTPDVLPKHKIISRSMSKSYNSIVMLHTSGTCYVRNYYMHELLRDEALLKDMDAHDIDLMQWVINSENMNLLDDIYSKRQKLIILD